MMEEIGRTDNGGYIVKLTRAEFSALNGLSLAIEGKTFTEIMSGLDGMTSPAEVATTLGAIKAFAKSVAYVNDIEQILRDLRDLLIGDQAEEAA